MAWVTEHHESYRAFAPKGLPQMVRWYVRAWRDEVPTTIHGGGIERMKPDRFFRPRDGTVVKDPGGGSRLGTPTLAPDFRAYIEGVDDKVEYAWSDSRPESSTSYVTPMLWTLRWLERNRHPLIAAALRFLGRNGGDTRTLAVSCSTCSSSVTLPDEYAEAVYRDALNLAWEHYREAPTTR